MLNIAFDIASMRMSEINEKALKNLIQKIIANNYATVYLMSRACDNNKCNHFNYKRYERDVTYANQLGVDTKNVMYRCINSDASQLNKHNINVYVFDVTNRPNEMIATSIVEVLISEDFTTAKFFDINKKQFDREIIKYLTEG